MRIDIGLAIVTLVVLAGFSGCGKTEPAPSGPAPSVKNEENPSAEGRSERRGPAEFGGQAASQGQNAAGTGFGEVPTVGSGTAGGAGDGTAAGSGTAGGAGDGTAVGSGTAGGAGDGTQSENGAQNASEAAAGAGSGGSAGSDAAAQGGSGGSAGSDAAAQGGSGARAGSGDGSANANPAAEASGDGSANANPAAEASGDGSANANPAAEVSGDGGAAATAAPVYVPPPFQNVDETKWETKARADMLQFLELSYRHRIKDPRVLSAMGNVPRHLYVLPEDREAGNAYKQMWYKIGYGQTITDPGMVAYMTQLLAIKPTDKVLEIGTGSGYQGSVLVQLTPNVFTIEIVEKLAMRSHKLLDSLGYGETVVHRRIADGYWGWEEEAPFDKIIVTCAADHVPVPLLQQLRPGGLMVVPVGPRYQPGKLHFIAKDDAGQVHEKVLGTVEFVPLTRKKVEKTKE